NMHMRQQMKMDTIFNHKKLPTYTMIFAYVLVALEQRYKMSGKTLCLLHQTADEVSSVNSILLCILFNSSMISCCRDIREMMPDLFSVPSLFSSCSFRSFISIVSLIGKFIFYLDLFDFSLAFISRVFVYFLKLFFSMN
ncbi:hypothetical protein L9F63_017563, partial [Diploptera punctata]